MSYTFEVALPDGRVITIEILAASEEHALDLLDRYLEEHYGTTTTEENYGTTTTPSD